MKILITTEEWDNKKATDLIPCECLICKKTFFATKNRTRSGLKNEKLINFCGNGCSNKFRAKDYNNIKSLIQCKNCGIEFFRYRSQIYDNSYCSRRCGGLYRSQHKKYGTKRSKLEKWIEQQLSILYSNLTVIYNNRETIGAELDIYIPSLKLAVELNGVFHYEPIYGIEKLKSIQDKDKIRYQLCLQHQIELLIIDVTAMKNFKEEKAKFYLNLITNIINDKLNPA